MSRPLIRTDTLDPAIRTDLTTYCNDYHQTHKAFHARFLSEISYSAFYCAIRGESATPELLQAISNAVDAAQWREIRAERIKCPSCQAALL